MSEEKKIELILNAEELIRALEQVQEKAEATEEIVDHVVETTDNKLKDSYSQALTLARSAYTVGLGMIKTTGVSVSYFFRSMISAAFGAIQILEPLLHVKGLATYDYVSMALGLAELSVAIAATIAAEREKTRIARGFRGAAMALGGLSQLLGTINFK